MCDSDDQDICGYCILAITKICKSSRYPNWPEEFKNIGDEQSYYIPANIRSINLTDRSIEGLEFLKIIGCKVTEYESLCLS